MGLGSVKVHGKKIHVKDELGLLRLNLSSLSIKEISEIKRLENLKTLKLLFLGFNPIEGGLAKDVMGIEDVQNLLTSYNKSKRS